MNHNSASSVNGKAVPPRTSQRKKILDFIAFEHSTSLTWPWAVPAKDILKDQEKLAAVEAMLIYNPQDGYDTDAIYDALDKVFGPNPILAEQRTPEDSMSGQTL